MSPEQLAGDPSAVDTRSDIYALGVIAYELLCGQLPLSVGGQPLPQMIRTLSENEPRRAGSIQRDLAGDIEAILSRALEKSPSRRYATAAEFAADIRRHLRHEPVLARSPSTLYQFRKFARRNRTLVTAGALTLAALVAGLAGTATFAWREREQAEHTRVEAARAQAVIQFLREMLAAVDPQAVRGRDVTVRQVLDAAAERIQSGELAGQPEVEAALRSTIGETYLGLGLYANARPHLETALSILRERHGVQHADTISNLNLLGRSLDGLAEFAESERLHREALDAQRQLHGGDSLHAAPLLADLGDCLLRQGELEEAETCQREALALRETKPGATPLEIAESLDRLGAVLFERGKPADAEPLFRRALEIRRAGLPPDHPDLAHVLNQLGFVLYRLEIWNEAESMLREALDIYRRTIDPRHPDLALCLNNLAMLMKRGQSPDAIPLLREAIDIQTHVLGPTHPEVGESLVNLGHALGAIGQFDEADRVTQRALEIQRQAFGPRHQDYAFALHNVAVARTQRGDPAGAEPLLREALSILEERLGPDHTYTSHMCDSLGVTLTRLERYAEAMSYIERALEQRQSTFADGHGHIAISRANRSLLRLRIGDAAGAVEDALAAIPPLRAHGGTPAHLATALLVLAEARIAQKSPFDATELHSAIDEAATLRREQYGARSWQFSDAERVRGLLLMHTGHYADADAVLREALTALDTQPATSDPEIHHTRRRIGRALATLHEDWHIRTAPVPGRRGSVNP